MDVLLKLLSCLGDARDACGAQWWGPGGFLGVSPIAGCFIPWEILLKWMMKMDLGVPPYFRKPPNECDVFQVIEIETN